VVPYRDLKLRTSRHASTRSLQRPVSLSPYLRRPQIARSRWPPDNELGFSVLSDIAGAVIERSGLRYEVDGETRKLLETAGNDVAESNGAGG
jgi:hypothetical protein